MPNFKIRVALFLNYFLFALFLNSVGPVILQVQRYFGVLQTSAAILEAFKDISIAVTCFLIASFVTRIGYKKSMLIALGLMAITSICIPLIKTFIAIKILFAVMGACFGLMKISVFGSIGLITKNEKEHIRLMNFIEAFFMLGIVTGYFVFSSFVDDGNPASGKWFNVYYLFGTISLLAFMFLFSVRFNETMADTTHTTISKTEFLGMGRLLAVPLVISFLACAFMYVWVEQSIMSWLPSYNNKVLQLSSSMSIQLTSLLAISIALGRLLTAIIIKKINWFIVVGSCLLFAGLLVFFSLPGFLSNDQLVNNWMTIPLGGYIFPLIGFFLAPVYPVINSVMLASIDKSKHGFIAGLLVVCSALGGVLGSLIMGYIFQVNGGEQAFYFSLIPMLVLGVAIFAFKKQKNKLSETRLTGQLLAGYAL